MSPANHPGPRELAWYFAYAGNLSLHTQPRRLAMVQSSQLASADGFALTFNKVSGGGVFSNVVPTPGAVVHGAIYRCVPQAMALVDKALGDIGRHYRPMQLQIQTVSGDRLSAITYIAGKKFSIKQWRPDPHYVARLLLGAHEHGLPAAYRQHIQGIATSAEYPGTNTSTTRRHHELLIF